MIDLVEYLKFALLPIKEGIATGKEKSVRSVDYSALKRTGIRSLIFDFDDTLAKDGSPLSLEMKKFLLNLKNKGKFKIGILSNCTYWRRKELEGFFSGTGIVVGKKNTKPNPEGFLELASQIGASPEKTAMIGDKLGVDLWGAKRAGIRERILVEKFRN